MTWSLIRRISGERLYEPGSNGDRDMPEDEQVHEEWCQLVRDWRSVWDSWNEVMERITLALSRSENPSDEDFKLEDRLQKQVDAANAKMDEFRWTLMRRSR